MPPPEGGSDIEEEEEEEALDALEEKLDALTKRVAYLTKLIAHLHRIELPDERTDDYCDGCQSTVNQWGERARSWCVTCDFE